MRVGEIWRDKNYKDFTPEEAMDCYGNKDCLIKITKLDHDEEVDTLWVWFDAIGEKDEFGEEFSDSEEFLENYEKVR